jgi:hypothetical protein
MNLHTQQNNNNKKNTRAFFKKKHTFSLPFRTPYIEHFAKPEYFFQHAPLLT